MKILLTGFDPFGGEAINPAWEAVSRVKAPEGAEILKLQVPTVFGKAADLVLETIKKEQPDAVILVGQAGGRNAVTPERVAINLQDATIPDNEGHLAQEEPVVPGGDTAYFSTLPVKAMVAAIQAAGIPAKLSYSAGTFVCNSLLYSVLHSCVTGKLKTRACFIHLPFLPQQAEKYTPPYPSLPLPQMITALESAIEAIL